MSQSYDVVIIGGGPAGYTAGLYSARSGFTTAIVEKLSPGGQMATTSVDNYPGFPETIDGFELGEKMQQGAERFGAKTFFATVSSVDLKSDPKVLETSSGPIQAKVVIIATGANPRHLGLPREENMSGKGVAYCATCDGRMFKDKVVAVNGGGNSAVEDAIYLAKICKKVYLVHRRDKLRATPVYWDSLKKNGVEIVWNSTVKGILGDSKVTGVELENVKTGATSELSVDGLFVAIGRKPESSLFAGQLDMDKAGYIIAGEDTKTSLPGVYAAGDVRTKAFRQIITAASDGANAVHSAEEILMK
ncbi:MAG: thioredoxin-disulfide reductase [Acidaminococcaceae bacterium]|jgi:thioredoxin reductase (NADPH)|nr:thioredoxin-disulfide reductase [Acidaminococcaceae bacterium]